MKRLSIYAISILIIMLAILAASCGGSNAGLEQPSGQGQEIQNGQAGFEGIPSVADLEEQFGNEHQDEEKSSSWISHPNHLTPALSHLTGVDPGDPNCYLLKGLGYDVAGVPKGPHFAYALYQIPLGALEPDLLSMKVAAQVGDPSQKYYAAIANFSALNWDFNGPLTSPDWYTDVPALGYDFTGVSGNMYFLLIALPDEELHVTEITLDFKPREKEGGDGGDVDSMWNIYGNAYNDYSSFDPYGGKLVTWESLDDGTTYSTITASSGAWGMNLPSGHYIFNVQDSEMLLDVSGGAVTHIDYLYDGGPIGLRMDIDGSGNVIYMDEMADWYGTDVPMPLITANGY